MNKTKKFAVHLFPVVRVKVTGVEATSVAEAMAKADASVNFHDILDNSRPGISNIECIAWDEGLNTAFVVDPLDDKGEVLYDETQWFDGQGNPLVEGETVADRKAAAADAATLFMKELLASVETLTGIAEEHGTRTLADLMYLQAAILEGSFIDNSPLEPGVMEVVTNLPSSERWMKFIRTERMAQRESGPA